MTLPDTIELLIRDITAPQAYEVIKASGNPGVNIFCKGQLYDLKDIVAEESIRWKKAAEVGPFTFWGGPPGRLTYYNGTLYTLLCDRLLDLIAAHGEQAAREICCVEQPQRVKERVWL